MSVKEALARPFGRIVAALRLTDGHVGRNAACAGVRAARMVAVAEAQTVHTADLDAATLMAVRALLDDVFGGMTGQDWEHALGGVTPAWEGAELIGHASVIQRRLLNGGRARAPAMWRRSGYARTGAGAGTAQP